MTWISSQLEFMSTLQMVLKGEAFFEMPTTLCNLLNYVKHGILGCLVLVCLCFSLILFPSHVSIYMMQCGQWCSRLVPMCSWYIDHLIFDVKHQRCDYNCKVMVCDVTINESHYTCLNFKGSGYKSKPMLGDYIIYCILNTIIMI